MFLRTPDFTCQKVTTSPLKNSQLLDWLIICTCLKADPRLADYLHVWQCCPLIGGLLAHVQYSSDTPIGGHFPGKIRSSGDCWSISWCDLLFCVFYFTFQSPSASRTILSLMDFSLLSRCIEMGGRGGVSQICFYM